MTATGAASSDDGLTIDIVSDLVCPWCYIGKRRLETALRRHNGAARIRWHPFQLNPDIPAGGVDRRSYLEAKFGGPERAQAIHARVEAAGRDAGIAFDFGRIARQPSTLDAHRLIEWGQSTDAPRADALVERMFRAYFTEGEDLGDADVLAALAADAGYDRADARMQLDTASGRDAIAAADARAKALGIDAVPFFIFNRRLAVSGAQPPEVFAEAIERAQALGVGVR